MSSYLDTTRTIGGHIGRSISRTISERKDEQRSLLQNRSSLGENIAGSRQDRTDLGDSVKQSVRRDIERDLKYFPQQAEERSTLAKAFDLLGTTSYGATGFIRGFTSDEYNPITGLASGISAGITGESHGGERHFTVDILDDLGWQPESTAGKIGRGVVGFVGDVVTDPLTYATGGLSGLIKGKGRAGAKLTHGMASETTLEGAEKIVRRQTTKRGVKLSPERIKDDAIKLASEINKQAGFSPDARDLRLTLEAFPFGRKLFGKHADKGITVAKAETMQNIGEATIAPGYAKIRDAIYGSKLGELFSTNTPLYRASKNNPEALMDFLRHSELTRGLAQDKRQAEQSIRKTAKEFGLSEADNKKILELMEDNTAWHKVKNTISFHDSQDAKRYRASISKHSRANEAKVDELRQKKKRIDDMEASIPSEKQKTDEYLQRLKRDYDKELRSLNLKHVQDKSKHEEAIKMYEEQLFELDRQRMKPTPKKLINDYENYKSKLGEARQQQKQADKLSGTLRRRAKEDVEHPDKRELVRDISKYIFGKDNPDFISADIDDRYIDTLMDAIKRGEKGLDSYVEKYQDIFSGKAKHIYKTIASELEYKNWYDDFQKPYDELVEKTKRVGYEGLSGGEKQELNKLENLHWQREQLKNYLFNAESHDELNRRISVLHDSRLTKDKEDLGEAIYHRNKYFTPEEELRRHRMEKEDFARADDYKNYRTGEFDAKPHRFAEHDDKADFYNKLLDHIGKSRKADDVNEQTIKWIRNVTNEIEPLLEDFYGKPYKSLTSRQKGDLLKKAIKNEYNASRNMSREFGVDASKQIRAKSMSDMTPEERKIKFAELKEDTFARRTKPGVDVDATLDDGSEIRATVRNFTTDDDNRKFIDVVNVEDGEYIHDLPVRRVSKVHDSDLALENVKTSIFNKAGKTFNVNSPKQVGKVLYEDLGLSVKKTAKGNYVTDKATLQSLADEHEIVDDILRYRDLVDDTPTREVDEITNISDVTDDFVRRQEDLKSRIRIEEDKIKQLEEIRQQEANKLANKFDEQQRRAKNNLKKLEEDVIKSRQAYNEQDIPEIERLTEEIEEMKEALTNDEALENFLRRWDKVSEAELDEVLAKYSVAEYQLDPNIDVNDKVRHIAEYLRNEMIKMGKKEVDINKLDHEAFHTLIDSYIPRIPTKEGARFFKNRQDELAKRLPGFGENFGYGRTFSPHMLSRKIKGITDADGNYINKPSMTQINEYFARNYPELKGKNVFSESVADIFLNRALKNNELMYDNYYIQHMFDMFGEEYEGVVEEGYKTVMNHGHLKEYTNNVARMETDMTISKAVSKYLQDNQIVRKISNRVDNDLYSQVRGRHLTQHERLWRKHQINKEVKQEIDKFVESNYPEEVRKKMYSDVVKDLAGDRLDDMAVPMVSTDSEHMTKLINRFDDSIRRYDEHIRDAFNQFENTKHWDRYNTPLPDRRAKEIRDKLPIDDIEELVDGYLTSSSMVDEADVATLNRVKNKILNYKNAHRPKAHQINDAIVQKANQARKAQILKDNSDFLKLWDKMTHFIKLNQTSIMPSYHGRNKMSNMFNSWLAIGEDVYNPRLQKETLQAVINEGNIDGGIVRRLSDGSTESWSWKEVYDSALDHGAIGRGYFDVDLGGTGQAQGALSRILPGQADPTDFQQFKPYELGKRVGKTIENQDRLLHFASQLSRGMSPEQATQSSFKHLFDYADLTAFEQNVMKRIMPYYTWIRKNAPLQMEMMMDEPRKYAYVSKLMGGVENMVDEEDRMNDTFVNQFAHDWVQTPFEVEGRHGRGKPVLWNPNLPFMDLSRMPDPTDMDRTVRQGFPQLHPAITAPIEQISNRNIFFDSDIIREGDSELRQRGHHVSSQFPAYGAVRGATTKSGADRALDIFDSMTGIKALGYDYDLFRALEMEEINNMSLEERLEKRSQNISSGQRVFDTIKNVSKGLVKGFSDSVSLATGHTRDRIDESRPRTPDEYTGVLRPISQEHYESLSEVEKQKYIPPTEEEAWAYNKKAVELEQAQIEQGNIFNRFSWALFDTMDLGDDYEVGKVVDLVDGDTFDVKVGDEVKRVRPLLMDTPETTGEFKDSPMPFGEEADEYAEEFLIDEDVRIVFDGSEKDMYGRTLGYVDVTRKGEDFGKRMIREGLARKSHVFEPPYQRQDEYREAQKKAYEEGENIWSIEDYTSLERGMESDFDMKADAVQRWLEKNR